MWCKRLGSRLRECPPAVDSRTREGAFSSPIALIRYRFYRLFIVRKCDCFGVTCRRGANTIAAHYRVLQTPFTRLPIRDDWRLTPSLWRLRRADDVIVAESAFV